MGKLDLFGSEQFLKIWREVQICTTSSKVLFECCNLKLTPPSYHLNSSNITEKFLTRHLNLTTTNSVERKVKFWNLATIMYLSTISLSFWLKFLPPQSLGYHSCGKEWSPVSGSDRTNSKCGSGSSSAFSFSKVVLRLQIRISLRQRRGGSGTCGLNFLWGRGSYRNYGNCDDAEGKVKDKGPDLASKRNGSVSYFLIISNSVPLLVPVSAFKEISN